MTITIVYDSLYGNTKAVAERLSEYFGTAHTTLLLPAAEAEKALPFQADLLVVGSPTHGGRPTPAVKSFLERIPAGTTTPILCFDTSSSPEGESGFVRFIIRFFGSAGPRMRNQLQKRGLTTLAAATFLVKGKEGPLCEGELEKAVGWAARQVELLRPKQGP